MISELAYCSKWPWLVSNTKLKKKNQTAAVFSIWHIITWRPEQTQPLKRSAFLHDTAIRQWTMYVLRCYCMKAMLWKYRGRVQYTMYDTILHLQTNARALHTFIFCETLRLSVPKVGGDQWDKRHRRGLTEGGLMPVIVTLLRLRTRGVILLQKGAEGRRYPKADRWLTQKKMIILRPNAPWWIHDTEKEKTTLIAGNAHWVKCMGSGTDVMNTWKTLLSSTIDNDPVFFVP